MINKTYAKIIFIALLLILAGMLGKFVMLAITDWRDSHFECNAKLVVKKQNSVLSVVITYFMDKDHGIAVLKGELTKDDQMYSVSRKSHFLFDKTQNLTHVKSTLAIDTPADNAPLKELKELLPLFYLQSNIQMEFGIYPQGWNGYIFTTGYVPSFYCRRN